MTDPIGLTAADQIAVVHNGELQMVAPQDAAQAFGAGARPATAEEIRESHGAEHTTALEQKYKDKLGVLAPFTGEAASVAGGVRGLGEAFGVPTDTAAINFARNVGGEGAAGKVRETLGDLKELHPYRSKGSELGGIAAGTIGLPESGIAGLGHAAEAGVAGVAGKSFLARRAANVVQGGLENAAFAGVDSMNEASLGNENLTAQKFVADVGHGALIGAIAGPVLGGGAELAGAALKGAGRSIADVLDAGKIDKKAGEIAFQAAGGTKGMAEAAEKYAGGAGKVGNIWREEAPAFVGKSHWSEMDKPDLLEAAEKGKAHYADKMNGELSKLDGAPSAAGDMPKISTLADEMEAKFIKPLEGVAGVGKTAEKSRLQSFIDQLRGLDSVDSFARGDTELAGGVANDTKALKDRLTFSEMHQLRMNADALWAGNRINPEFNAFKPVRDFLEEQLITHGDVAAAREGAEFAANWKQAKEGYQAFKILDKAAAKGVAAGNANQFLGLTDKIFGAAGAGVGAALGGGVGSMLGGAAAGAASKFVRSRFGFVAPGVMTKASAILGLKAANEAVNKEISAGVKGFFAAKAIRALPPAAFTSSKGETKRQAYQKTVDHLAHVQADPSKSVDAVVKATPGLDQHAPKVAQAIATTTARATAFLVSKIPPGQNEGKGPVPHLQEVSVSDFEIASFGRYVSAVQNPKSVFASLKQGTITSEEVEAMKAVYPDIYTQLVTEMQSELAAQKKPPPYVKILALSDVFGMPLDETTQPDFIAAIQASFAPMKGDGSPQDQASNKPPKKPLGIVAEAQTSIERVEAGASK